MSDVVDVVLATARAVERTLPELKHLVQMTEVHLHPKLVVPAKAGEVSEILLELTHIHSV